MWTTPNFFNEPSSVTVLFDATSGDKVYQPVCADIGAAVTLMDENLFQNFLTKKFTSKWTISRKL